MAGYASAKAVASLETTRQWIETRQQADSSSRPNTDEGPQFLATVWILTIVATIFIVLRVYCKITGHKKLWWDDYVLAASWICLMVQTSLLTVLVPMGFAKHSWAVTNWPEYLMVANVTGVFSIVAAAWSKTSFAITLLRISEGWVRRVVWGVIITVNLFLGLSGLFTYVQCNPIEKVWNSSVEGSCWPGNVVVTYNSFSSAWSGACDMLLATLPWKILRTPSLTRKERIGVSIAMSMGVFAGMTSIGKVVTLYAITDPDPIAGVPMMILATAEIAITIIAASIPVLRALIRKSIPSQLSPHFYRSYHSRTGSHGTARSRGTAHSRGNSHNQNDIRSASLAVLGEEDRLFVLGASKTRSSRANVLVKHKWPGSGLAGGVGGQEDDGLEKYKRLGSGFTEGSIGPENGGMEDLELQPQPSHNAEKDSVVRHDDSGEDYPIEVETGITWFRAESD